MTGASPGAARAVLADALGRFRALLPRRADLMAVRRNPRGDLLAGATVAMVALPLALAFGITSGVGATAGLVTAVVAGAVAALLGGSNLQVSGPTGAMTVVLIPIVAVYGAGGVLVVGVLAGLVLVVLAYTGAGRAMRYVPLPVVEGFTVGIAVIIALQQIPAAFGTRGSGSTVVAIAADAIRSWWSTPRFAPVLLALCVAGAMLAAARYRPAFPVSLLAVLAAAVVTARVHLDAAVIGEIPSGIPMPQLPAVPVGHLSALLLPAVAVATLAALESLLCAAVADGMSVGERHDPNRELFGQGMANLIAPLFGGIPATAAIARTAVNVRAGARSRLAALTHSIVLLIIMLVASRWVGTIPLAALAGVLLATAVQMIEVSSVRALMRATRRDAVVLVVTAISTVAFDLVTAVILGLVVAGALALQQMAQALRVEEVPLDTTDHEAEEQALLAAHIVAYRLDGALFFGAAHNFLLELSEVADVRVVVLRMSRIDTLDATCAAILADTVKRLESRGTTVLLSGVRGEHTCVLEHLGVYDQLAHERHVFGATPDAIAHARVHAAREYHVAYGTPTSA